MAGLESVGDLLRRPAHTQAAQDVLPGQRRHVRAQLAPGRTRVFGVSRLARYNVTA